MKRKVYLYQRFSTAKQDFGSSEYRQSEAQQKWLKEHPEYEEAETYIDKNKSGYDGSHIEDGKLKLIIQAIENKDIEPGSIILIERMSRFSRLKIIQTINLLDKLWQNDITLVTTYNNQFYDKDNVTKQHIYTQLTGEIFGANLESDEKRDRAIGSYNDRFKLAQQGYKFGIKEPGNKKFSLPKIPFWINRDGSLNEQKEIIKYIFKRYYEGIGQFLIREELKDRFSDFEKYPIMKNIQANSVLRWIKSESVIGNWKGQRIFKPVVDDDEFYAIQKIVEQRKKKNRTKKSLELSGLAECAYCGSTMSVTRLKKSPPLLRCVLRQREGSKYCQSSPTYSYPVAKFFFESVVKNNLIKDLSQNLLNKSENIELNEISYEISQINQRINLIEKRIKTDDIGLMDKLLNILGDLTKEKLNLESRVDNIKINMKSRTYLADEIKDIKKKPEQLHQLFLSLEKRMRIKDDHIYFEDYWLKKLKYEYSTDSILVETNFLPLNRKIENIPTSHFRSADIENIDFSSTFNELTILAESIENDGINKVELPKTFIIRLSRNDINNFSI